MESDLRFKAFLRLSIRRLKDALKAETQEQKESIIKQLIEDYQNTLED